MSLPSVFYEIRNDVYELARTLYGPSTKWSTTFPPPSFDTTSSISSTPSITEVHHYHHGPYIPLIPGHVTNVYTGNTPKYDDADDDDKKKKKKKQEDNFFGAVLLGALTIGASYVVTSEYVKYRRLANVNEKMAILKIANNTSLSGANPSVRNVLREWKKWHSSYTSTTRLFHLAKVTGFVSAGAIAFGLWKNLDNVVLDGFWGLVATSAYTVGLWTLYTGLWKENERELMDTLVGEFNSATLASIPFPTPTSTPTSAPTAPSESTDIVASLYPSYAKTGV